MREDVNLLICNGFDHAADLPLSTVWVEAEIIRNRENDRLASEAILVQVAVVDVVAGGNHLQDVIKDMRGE